LLTGEPAPCPPDQRAICTAVHTQLIDRLGKSTGGAPATVPAAYAARSPVSRFAGLVVPTMNIYGETDYLVDVGQACRLRSALQTAGLDPWTWYFDAALSPRSPATVCGGGFRTDAPGNTWAHRHYLLVYAGQGHGFAEPALGHAIGAGLVFLLNRL